MMASVPVLPVPLQLFLHISKLINLHNTSLIMTLEEHSSTVDVIFPSFGFIYKQGTLTFSKYRAMVLYTCGK